MKRKRQLKKVILQNLGEAKGNVNYFVSEKWISPSIKGSKRDEWSSKDAIYLDAVHKLCRPML